MNLHLTSPLMHGKDVEHAQRALNNSKFGDFYDGPIDGKYGEHTANSTRKAWWFLGFPKSAVSRHYEDRLDWYLTGKKKLTNSMSKTREQRKKEAAQQQQNVYERALAVAKKQVGVHEVPAGSDNVKFTDWYGVHAPWCAIFISWCFDQVKWPSWRYSYVPTILAAAHQGQDDMRVVNVEHARHCKTDLALWHFAPSDHYPNHVSWVLEVSGNEVRSLDGNTLGDGEVAYRTRLESLVQAYVHIDK